jgi:xylose isomerase
MSRKYSVFLGNAGGCSDRYCGAYDRPYATPELYERVASVPLLKGVDLVATPGMLEEIKTHKQLTGTHNLKVVSVVADHFTEAKWRDGSFTATDPAIRAEAVSAAARAMDAAAELGCSLMTIWPGQDGYDYPFATDYEQQRAWFTEGLREVCTHRPDMRVSLEYKLKEPRTHSYVSTVGTALLMVQETGCANLGIVLDYGHALLGGENPAESLALLKRHGDRLMHIHINDNYRSWDDDMIVGSVHTIELLEFLYWLRRTDYQGWITLDQFPYRQNGRDAIAESAAWLDALEGVLDRSDMNEIATVLASKDAVAATRMARRLVLQGAG